MNIELTEAQAKELIAHLSGYSDVLTKRHAEEHSGVSQFLLMSAIQGVDRLYQEIKEQVEAQAEPEVYPVPEEINLVL